MPKCVMIKNFSVNLDRDDMCYEDLKIKIPVNYKNKSSGEIKAFLKNQGIITTKSTKRNCSDTIVRLVDNSSNHSLLIEKNNKLEIRNIKDMVKLYTIENEIYKYNFPHHKELLSDIDILDIINRKIGNLYLNAEDDFKTSLDYSLNDTSKLEQSILRENYNIIKKNFEERISLTFSYIVYYADIIGKIGLSILLSFIFIVVIVLIINCLNRKNQKVVLIENRKEPIKINDRVLNKDFKQYRINEENKTLIIKNQNIENKTESDLKETNKTAIKNNVRLENRRENKRNNSNYNQLKLKKNRLIK